MAKQRTGTKNLMICDCGDCQTAIERALVYFRKASADGDCPLMVATVGATIGNMVASALLTHAAKVQGVKTPQGMLALAGDVMAQLGQRSQDVQEYAASQAGHADLMRFTDVVAQHFTERERDEAAIKAGKPEIG